jgi:hypothetical protein
MLSQMICDGKINEAATQMSGFLSLYVEINYSVFQGFRKAKSANGGLILSSSQFLILPQLPQKNKARFKSGQS